MNKHGNLIWSCVLLFYIVICFLGALLLINDGVSDVDAFLFFFMYFGFLIFLVIFFTHIDIIDTELISYEKINDDLIVKYKDYKIEIIKDTKKGKFIIPRYDMDNKKLGLLFRETLRNHLTKQYDYLSLPENIIPVDVANIQKYFKDLKICNDTDKELLINQRHFRLFYYVIFIIVLININYIVKAFTTGTISPGLFKFFVLLIIIFISNYISEGKKKKLEQNGEMYSCKVYVFDKHVDISDDSSSYYVRVWDHDKHVLMRWFAVDKHFYEMGDNGTLYYIVSGNKYDVVFKKGEDLD